MPRHSFLSRAQFKARRERIARREDRGLARLEREAQALLDAIEAEEAWQAALARARGRHHDEDIVHLDSSSSPSVAILVEGQDGLASEPEPEP